VAGTEHGFQTANLIVQVVNDATPAQRIEPNTVTIHPATYDVSVTFQSSQSGRVILNGTGMVSPFEKAFSDSTAVTIAGSDHAFGSAKFGWFCFDNSSPKRWIEPNQVTIDTSTYDFAASFTTPQSGSCTLVSGSGQGSAGGGSVSSVFGRTGAVAAQSGDYTASQITNAPSGGVAATNLQAAINELDTGKSATSHSHSLLGDASGSLASVTVSRIQGRSVASTAPTDGQGLVWSATGNQWQPGTVAGGGGASSAADLNDFKVVRTSGSVLTVNGGCSATKPCVARFGNKSYAFTASATATVSGGSGQVYWYLDPAGTLVAGHSGLTISCSGCATQSDVTQFPADSLPLFVWSATSGTWDDTGTDFRAFLSAKQVIAGTGVIVTETNGRATVAVDAAVVGLRVATPPGAVSPCTTGSWAADDSWFYVCVSANTWRRAAVSSW
jgi:hypothetical protein